jgi:para-aminobenzoate synthetase component 1
MKMTNHFPYILLEKQQIAEQINRLSALRVPFLFVIDYKAEKGYVIEKKEMDERFVKYESSELTEGRKLQMPDNAKTHNPLLNDIQWQVKPVRYEVYKSRIDYIQLQIHKGNSFLTNLTQPSEVTTNLTLPDLFQFGTAKYKLWLKGKFTVLSPETFVQITDGVISSFPMKGTIDASIPNAREIILNDPKEKAEHATIVDLIRNDLSLVAEQVEVKRYRYIDNLHTNKGDLLQVSSEIAGKLPTDYHSKLGDILMSLLPAGSISGAPKQKTLRIIAEAEGYERYFYTGICGFFDGENLDSAVMIRFIEQQGDKLLFKSGGGITAMSNPQKEYEELIQKVYVPVG